MSAPECRRHDCTDEAEVEDFGGELTWCQFHADLLAKRRGDADPDPLGRRS